MTDESCLHNMPLSDQIEYLNQWCLQLGIRRKQIRKKIMKIHTEITELEYDTMKLYKGNETDGKRITFQLKKEMINIKTLVEVKK